MQQQQQPAVEQQQQHQRRQPEHSGSSGWKRCSVKVCFMTETLTQRIVTCCSDL
jgi:hypothetical protein